MSDAGDEADRYRLPEAENRRIFYERIVPQQFAHVEPQEVPVVVFLVGQPGAGKARVSQMLAEQLNQRGGFVDVDSDLYKPYHPAYDTLMAEDDTLMAAYTRADGRAWTAQAHDHVRAHKVNAIIQDTAQNSEFAASTMTAYPQAGFRLEALVLAVPEAMSNQGIVNRYYEQVQDRGSGRLTVQRNADASYLGILALADLIDDRCLVDQVGVFRRGEAQPRYSNRLDTNGQWQQGSPALRSGIETERDRLWTEEETTDFLKVDDKLTIGLGPTWHDRLADIERAALPLMAHTAAYASWERPSERGLSTVKGDFDAAQHDIAAADAALDAREHTRSDIHSVSGIDVGPGVEPPQGGEDRHGPEHG